MTKEMTMKSAQQQYFNSLRVYIRFMSMSLGFVFALAAYPLMAMSFIDPCRSSCNEKTQAAISSIMAFKRTSAEIYSECYEACNALAMAAHARHKQAMTQYGILDAHEGGYHNNGELVWKCLDLFSDPDEQHQCLIDLQTEVTTRMRQDEEERRQWVEADHARTHAANLAHQAQEAKDKAAREDRCKTIFIGRFLLFRWGC